MHVRVCACPLWKDRNRASHCRVCQKIGTVAGVAPIDSRKTAHVLMPKVVLIAGRISASVLVPEVVVIASSMPICVLVAEVVLIARAAASPRRLEPKVVDVATAVAVGSRTRTAAARSSRCAAQSYPGGDIHVGPRCEEKRL